MAEWYDDDAFWNELYPFLFPPKAFEAAPEEAEKILRLVDFQGSTILDLACGPGRHSVALAQKGYRVTGVDRSAFYLEKARSQADSARATVEWVQEDMRLFTRPDSFDLALSLFTSFGYFEEEEDDLRVLKGIHENLRAHGVCVLDLVGKEWLARQFQPTLSSRLADGRLVVQEHEVIDDWTRIRNVWHLIDGEKVRSFRFQHRVYSGAELKERLRRSGFERIRLYGDLDGNEYGTKAKRLIAVARKG